MTTTLESVTVTEKHGHIPWPLIRPLNIVVQHGSTPRFLMPYYVTEDSQKVDLVLCSCTIHKNLVFNCGKRFTRQTIVARTNLHSLIEYLLFVVHFLDEHQTMLAQAGLGLSCLCNVILFLFLCGASDNRLMCCGIHVVSINLIKGKKLGHDAFSPDIHAQLNRQLV